MFASPGDSASCQVIRRKLYGNFVSRQDAYIVHTKFPGNMRQDLMAVFELNFERGIRECIRNNAFNFNYIILGQIFNPPIVYPASL